MCSSMKMLSQNEIMEAFGITRGHLHNLRKRKIIPEANYLLGDRMPRWPEEKIRELRGCGPTADEEDLVEVIIWLTRKLADGREEDRAWAKRQLED